ncbi:MAG: Polymer-forming cytoskeletal [Pelotomaculum sp. PtaB.Bin104]|nr:MAG: Polymer-forming cytoskeletal [Pelotomaculum sp. PtaB.Bin104]
MFKGKKWTVPAFIFLIMFILTAPAVALEVVNGDSVLVPAGVIEGPLFTAGNDIVIDADVEGDIFAAGQTITINGRVNGDVLAAAQTIRINGPVSGNARCAAQDIDLRGELGQSLTAAGSEVRLLEDSRVHRDALVFAGQINTAGTVGRQLMGAGGTARLNGAVDGDVKFWGIENLSLGPAAVIGGNLAYGSPREATIAPGAKVAGTTVWERQEPKAPPQPERKGFSFIGALLWFAAGVLVWCIITLIFPGLWSRLSQTMRQAPGYSLGWGLVLLLMSPLVGIVLLITVIGIPLALALLVIYGALIYAAHIITGDAIGRLLAARFGWEGRVNAIFPFMLGLVLLQILTSIPILGWLAGLVAVCLAMGTVFLTIYRWRQV